MPRGTDAGADWDGLTPPEGTSSLSDAVGETYRDSLDVSREKTLLAFFAGLAAATGVISVILQSAGIFPQTNILTPSYALLAGSIAVSVIGVPAVQRLSSISLETAVRRNSPYAMGAKIAKQFQGGPASTRFRHARLAAGITGFLAAAVGIAASVDATPPFSFAALGVVAAAGGIATAVLTMLGVVKANEAKSAAVQYAKDMPAHTRGVVAETPPAQVSPKSPEIFPESVKLPESAVKGETNSGVRDLGSGFLPKGHKPTRNTVGREGLHGRPRGSASSDSSQWGANRSDHH